MRNGGVVEGGDWVGLESCLSVLMMTNDVLHHFREPLTLDLRLSR